MRSWMATGRAVTRGLGVCAAWLLFGGCDPMHTEFDAIEPAELETAAELHDAPQPFDRLRFLTWNIRYGAARTALIWDCVPGDVSLLDVTTVEQNIDNIAARIREADPDIVFLQEVDRASKRSGYVDMLQRVLDNTDLNYAAYVSMWRVDFLPNDGMGPMDHGQAVLSRWPLLDATRKSLPQVTTRPPWERYFHLHRALLTAKLHVPGHGPIELVLLHADADDDFIKRLHVDLFENELIARDDDGAHVIGGGDFNTLPPGATIVHDFPDEQDCTNEAWHAGDHRGEEQFLDALYDRFHAALPLPKDVADVADIMTFTHTPAAFWTRQLDYFFSNRPLVGGRVLQDERTGTPTLPLSDHAPVVVDLVLP